MTVTIANSRSLRFQNFSNADIELFLKQTPEAYCSRSIDGIGHEGNGGAIKEGGKLTADWLTIQTPRVRTP